MWNLKNTTKILGEMGIQTTVPACWEIWCRSKATVRTGHGTTWNNRLVLNWERSVKAVYCHPAYLTSSGSDSKTSVCNAGDLGLIPRLGRSPWRRKWQPTPVFLLGKSHGLWSLVGYHPWGRKESDMPEWLHFHFHVEYIMQNA